MIDKESLKEAVTIGAFITPLFAVVRELVDEVNFTNERSKDYISVFVAGAMFHIIAEASGVNEWYLNNSAAYRKWMVKSKHVDTPSTCPDGRVCTLALWASQA
jgi:hypothetical protein